MKWLVACALVLVPALAAAHRPPPPPRIPTLARACPTTPTYEALESCLEKLGRVTIVRDLTHARLLRVRLGPKDGESDLGLALYVQDGQGWHIGGVYEPRGLAYEPLSLEPLTVDKHSGFRIDIGIAQHTWAAVDAVHAMPVIVMSRHVLLCDGTRWRCIELVVGCDTLVRGAAVWTFHGELSVADNQAHVAGDRTHTGTSCSVPETVFLGWPQR